MISVLARGEDIPQPASRCPRCYMMIMVLDLAGRDQRLRADLSLSRQDTPSRRRWWAEQVSTTACWNSALKPQGEFGDTFSE